MSEELPAPVRAYVEGKNARDFDAAAAAFLPDAVVRDEGHTHRGRAEIRAWMEDTAAKYDDQTAVKRVTRQDETVEVVAEVSGTFPGSPADIRFRFRLEGDAIAALEAGA